MTDKDHKLLAGRRILVVEDEYFLADDMSAALAQLGAEIVGPENTTQGGLARLGDAGQVHAAGLDVNLNGDAIFPLADALREREIPFVFGTGYEASALPEAYRDVPRWQKPFNALSLAAALEPLMACRTSGAE